MSCAISLASCGWWLTKSTVMPRSLTENFVKQFELCKVTPGEVVAVIAELGQKEEYVSASVAAPASSVGAASSGVSVVAKASSVARAALVV